MKRAAAASIGGFIRFLARAKFPGDAPVGRRPGERRREAGRAKNSRRRDPKCCPAASGNFRGRRKFSSRVC